MKIDRIQIDGFGEYGGASLPPMDRPVTIFYGPNEAGKSTLLAFIQTVLFGFPLRGAVEYYPPHAGGNHGGRIEFVSDAGEHFTVERHRGPKGGPMTITTADGLVVPDFARPALLGHATASTFRSVFAFDLDKLQQLESGDDSGINSRIYSAGSGAAQLPQALKQLKERAEDIYTPRGSKQPVARVLAELQDLDGKLRETQSQSQEYGEAVSRSAKLEREGVATDAERVATRALVEELQRRRQAWDTWEALLEVETRLSEIPDRKGFPDDPIVRLSNLEDQRREADDGVSFARDQSKRAQEPAERSVNGEELLRDAAAVEAIRRVRGSFDALVRDLPKRKAELRAKELEVARALRELGPDWDEERLVEFDTSIPRRDEVEQWKARLASARQRLRDLAAEAERVHQAADEARQRLQDAQERLDNDPAASQMSRDTLDAQRSALPTARSCLIEYEQAEQRCRDLAALALDDSEATSRWQRFAMPVVLGLLGIMLGVLGFISGREPAILVVGVALVAAAAVAYALTLASTRAEERGPRRRMEGACRQADDTRAAFVAALQPFTFDLEASRLPGHDELNAVEVALKRDDEQHQDRARRVAALDDVTKDAERQQERFEAAGRQRDEQQATVDTATAEWSSWLRQQCLPETLMPDTISELFSRVETARVVVQTASEKRARIAAIQKDIDAYSTDVKVVADGHPGFSTSGNDSSMAVAQLADRIVERFNQTQEAVRARTEAVRVLEDRETSLDQATSRRTGIDNRIRYLLSQAQTNDGEEFRRWARQHLERQDLERQRREYAAGLRAACGHERDIDDLRSTFASTTKEETDDALRQAESTLAELGSRTTEQYEERGRLQERMQSLSSDEAASLLRGRREELVEELRALATEWSKLVVARFLLVRARNKHQEERQPDVVRRAATFFQRLTGGRYTKIHVTVGEQEITVVDKTGRRKVPEQLSRGTLEQLYLALRFGLIKSVGEETERLPVVVDEVLVNFDLERARCAAAAFVELSRTNQVLVLTCHEWIVDLFRGAAPDAAVVDLSAVWAAP